MRTKQILGFVATFLSLLSAVITIFAFVTGISSFASMKDHWSRTESRSSHPLTSEDLVKENFQPSDKPLVTLGTLFTGLVDGAYSPIAAWNWRFPPYGEKLSSPVWYYAGIYIGIGGVMGIMALLTYATSRFQERLPRTASSLKRDTATVINLLGVIPASLFWALLCWSIVLSVVLVMHNML